jgi:hypothetical protein
LTEPDDGPTTPGWDWVTAEYEFAGLIFARGSKPERLIEVFGADPSAALPLTAEATYQTFGYPWVRVGQAGKWAFAIDDGSVDLEGPALELSADAEVARFDLGVNLDYFYFYVGGVVVTAFEPLMAFDRWGTDPDRFLSSMRQAGLDVDPPPDTDDGAGDLEQDLRIALLSMLTLALGIKVPREVGLGQLLSFQSAEPEPRGWAVR